MADQSLAPRWFPEPTTPDLSPAGRGEQPREWYARSTTARARATRRFLNTNLAFLPEEAQPTLARALNHRWESALFELVVARTLQLLGAELVVEPESEAGTRIDFLGVFPDTTISVEAISPQFHQDIGIVMRDQQPLLAIIEELVPAEWSVMVWELPALGPQEPKRAFQQVVARLLDVPPPSDYHGPVELQAEFDSGDLRIRLWPRRESTRPIIVEPGGAFVDDSEQRIRRAVKRKRRQARGSDVPTLVAIHGSGMATDLEDFDMALLGRRVAVCGTGRQPEREYFEPDGVFAPHGNTSPTFAGALAFLPVSPMGGPDPILYCHPRSTDTLPAALLSLEQRRYDPQRAAPITIPASRLGVVDGLQFITLEELQD